MSDIQPVAAACPKCGHEKILCRYNRFHRAELRIDAWEHKCGNCGHRDTIAYRNDNDEGKVILESPARCPYCNRPPSVAPEA